MISSLRLLTYRSVARGPRSALPSERGGTGRVLVGREAELTVLDALVRQTAAGAHRHGRAG